MALFTSSEVDTSSAARRRRGAAALLISVAVIAASCGTDETEPGEVVSGTGATTTVGGGDGSSTTVDGDGTTAVETTAGTGSTTDGSVDAPDPLDDDELPGDVFEGFAQDGDELIVVGVAFDDVLNLRAGPGTNFEVVAALEPTGEVVATGRARSLSRSIWYEVEVDGVIGWSNLRFLAFPGPVTDVTSQIVSSLGELPGAETMLDLGRIVAEDRASTDVESLIVVSVAPEVGDLGEITYDVIGLADDSVGGYRLHVFGTPDESGEGFGLKSVEQQALCLRGLSSGGLCT